MLTYFKQWLYFAFLSRDYFILNPQMSDLNHILLDCEDDLPDSNLILKPPCTLTAQKYN